MRNRFSVPPIVEGVPAGLASVLIATYGVGVVALFASGKASLTEAGLLLGVPVVLAIAMLRPEWTVLVLVAVPPSVISRVRPMQMVAIMLTAVFGFLLQGRLHLGPKTGVYPLVGIIAWAMVMKADTPADATAVADGMLKVIIYYGLLMLVAFNAAANERMHIDTFLNGLLIGLVGAAILQPFFGGYTGFEGFKDITHTPFRGQFAYLSVIGFGVSYVRFSLGRYSDHTPHAIDAFLTVAFLFLVAIGFGRAAWIAGLLVFGVVSVWTGKKSFWIVSCLLLALALTVPLIGERIFPRGSTDIANPETLARVTTGRSVLWEHLWERGVDALPFGNGWGYMWTLTPSDIFGSEGIFVTKENPFVFPHNDFLYLFVELGILGLGLLVAYWLYLFRKIRLVSRRGDESARYGVRVLVPVIIVMFLVQLFDNGFAIRFVAERFFIAAGLVFGLQYLVRQGERSAPHSRSLDTSQGIGLLDA